MKAGEIAVSIINQALLLIPTEKEWAGNTDAFDKKGNVCPSISKEAVRFGGCGSLMAASHHFHKESRFRDAAYSSAIDFLQTRFGPFNINDLDYESTVRLFNQALGR